MSRYRINWMNPLARGLQACILSAARRELVFGGLPTIRGQGRFSSGPYGQAIKTVYTGDAANDVSFAARIDASSDRTIAALLSNENNTVGSALPVVVVSDADSTDQLAVSQTQFAGVIDNNGSPVVTIGNSATPKLLTARRIGNQVDASVDGVYTSSNITGTRALQADYFLIGRSTSSDSTLSATVYLAAYWNRALSNAETAALALDPWQLFERNVFRTYSVRKSTAVTTSTRTVVAAGGLTFGGAATVSYVGLQTYSYAATGGITFGGAATAARARAAAGSGGITLSGAATQLRTRAPAPSGGITFGGAATVSYVGVQTYSYAATGGITFSGAATAARAGARVAAGGLTFSGAATAARARAATASGGISFAGASPALRTAVRATSGGLSLAGAATAARVRAIAADGGMIFAGAATVARARTTTASGGVTFAGAATPARVRVSAPSGGLTFAGAADVSFPNLQMYSYTASGGIVFGGAAAPARHRAVVATGGITFGGEGDLNYVRAITTSGGITFSGAARVRFQYAGGVDATRHWYRLGLGF